MIDQHLGQLEDFDQGRAIDFREARKLMRGRGGCVSLEVARRWANPERGYRARQDGPVLVLPAVKISGEWFTMPSWVAAFECKRIEAGRGAAGRPPGPTTRTPKQRETANRRVEKELDRLKVHAPRVTATAE